MGEEGRMSVPPCHGCAQQLQLSDVNNRCPDCTSSGRVGLLSPELLADPLIRAMIADHNLGGLFLAVRADLDIGQGILGEVLDIPQAKVCAIEKGVQSSFRPQTQTRVLVRLGVPPNLLGFSSPTADIVNGGAEEATGLREYRSELTAHGHRIPDDIRVTDRRTVLQGGVAVAALLAAAQVGAAVGPGPLPAQGIGDDAGPSWFTGIEAAVTHPGAAMRAALADREHGPLSLRKLRSRVDTATTQSLLSTFHTLGTTLPALIGHSEALAVSNAARRDPRRALAALSDTYALVGWTAIKAGRVGTARLAAERSVQAAEEADDPVRAAAAVRCLAEVEMSAGHYELAVTTALLATTRLTAVPPEQATSIRGAALLSAAAAAARGRDAHVAHACQRAAESCATGMVAENYALATVFGPTNLAIHEVAIRVDLDDPRGAAQHVPHLGLDRLPKILAERHGRALIDVARVRVELGDNDSGLATLLEAEEHAPDEVRAHRHTRTLLRRLAPHERAGSGLRELAGRCNVEMDELS
jgi:hypothetical protein